jgi:hypothetical protein
MALSTRLPRTIRSANTWIPTMRWFGDLSSSERAFEGVSEEVSKRIQHHAHQPQTAVSLQTLLQTGRGEFLHKTYKNLEEDNNDRGATGKVLIQVSTVVFGIQFVVVWTCPMGFRESNQRTNIPFVATLAPGYHVNHSLPQMFVCVVSSFVVLGCQFPTP